MDADCLENDCDLDYWGEEKFKNNAQFVINNDDSVSFTFIFASSSVNLATGIIV